MFNYNASFDARVQFSSSASVVGDKDNEIDRNIIRSNVASGRWQGFEKVGVDFSRCKCKLIVGFVPICGIVW